MNELFWIFEWLTEDSVISKNNCSIIIFFFQKLYEISCSISPSRLKVGSICTLNVDITSVKEESLHSLIYQVDADSKDWLIIGKNKGRYLFLYKETFLQDWIFFTHNRTFYGMTYYIYYTFSSLTHLGWVTHFYLFEDFNLLKISLSMWYEGNISSRFFSESLNLQENLVECFPCRSSDGGEMHVYCHKYPSLNSFRSSDVFSQLLRLTINA